MDPGTGVGAAIWLAIGGVLTYLGRRTDFKILNRKEQSTTEANLWKTIGDLQATDRYQDSLLGSLNERVNRLREEVRRERDETHRQRRWKHYYINHLSVALHLINEYRTKCGRSDIDTFEYDQGAEEREEKELQRLRDDEVARELAEESLRQRESSQMQKQLLEQQLSERRDEQEKRRRADEQSPGKNPNC